MTDPTQPPVTGYPAPPINGYPHPPPNYNYPNHNPYHAPPPGTYYYPPQQRATFLRRFLSTLIFMFIIMGTILFIVWLILRPRPPSFTVTTFSLTSLNLTTSPSPLISAAWSLRFSVVNPNHKLDLYYDEIETYVYYKSFRVATNQLPPFDQPTKNISDISATLTAAGAYIDPSLANSFNDEHSKGNVKFNVQVWALIRFKSGRWGARRRFLKVVCMDLPLDIPAKAVNGSMTGGFRRCSSLI